VGDKVKQGINLQDFDQKKEVLSLMGNSFSGYVIVTSEGLDGIEEGALILKSGMPVGALYEYSKFDITVFGEGALPKIFNAFLAKYGVVDIYSLSNQQVDLVTAFNDRIKIENVLDQNAIKKLFPSKYSLKLAEEVLSQVLEKHESRTSILKKLGLSALEE
jgi:hypothetical protein